MPADPDVLHVVQLSVYLDPDGRPPARLVEVWPGFARGAAAAQAHGVRVTVVQAAAEDAVHEIRGVACHFVRDTLPLLRLPGVTLRRARPPRLLRRVRKAAPRVIHFEGLAFPRQAGALARAFPGVPVLAQDHGSQVPLGWRRRVHAHGFASLAGVLFTAAEQAAPFTAVGVLRPGLPVYEVIEGSTDFTPGDRAAARAATGVSGDPCLLWLGHLDQNKDPLTVLEAVDRVAIQLPGVRLYMGYRASPLMEQVRARIAASERLRAAVHLLGPLSHERVEQHLRAADFLVQASHREGSGYAVIESLACGTPPLVTDIPSFRRITGDGAHGGLFPVGDADGLAREVLKGWSGDREAARRRAVEYFRRALSWDAIGAQLAAAYRAAAGVGPA